MITDDPRKTEIYRRTTQQLRNVLDSALWSKVIRGRWFLSAGYVMLMAASLPTSQTPWYRDVLFFVGCSLGLAAAYVSRASSGEKRPLQKASFGDEPL